MAPESSRRIVLIRIRLYALILSSETIRQGMLKEKQIKTRLLTSLKHSHHNQCLNLGYSKYAQVLDIIWNRKNEARYHTLVSTTITMPITDQVEKYNEFYLDTKINISEKYITFKYKRSLLYKRNSDTNVS